MMYNKVVMDHFRNPRNVGTIRTPTGSARSATRSAGT